MRCLWFFGLLLSVGFAVGCTAVFDFEKQCDADSDCAGDRCIAGECIAGALQCTLHTDCDQRPAVDGTPNGTELCIAGQCEVMLFEHESGGGCTELFGRVTEDPAKTLVIPTLQSMTGEGSAFGPETALNGYRMAARFANESGGLGQRSVVMVLCDDASQARAAEEIAGTIIERTGATSMLGPTGEVSQDAILNVTIPNDVMIFGATSSLLFSTLVDNDLAFRVYPSDRLSLEGFESLARRYPNSSIGLMYREDVLVRRVLAESLIQALFNERVTAAGYEGADATSIAAAAKEIADGNGGAPVDLLFIMGLGETADAVVAYRDALPMGFTQAQPRIVTDAPGALTIPSVVAAIDEITPFDMEAIVGAAISTEDFAALLRAAFDTNENLQLAGVFYDAAMLTLFAHAAVPEAQSGRELAAAMRARVTAPTGQPVQGSNGILAFGNAAVALANGGAIQYIQAAGGRPTAFDANGDVGYPIVAGTFPNADTSFFFPLRALFNGIWLDACTEPGSACGQGWTAEDDDPGQACVDVGLGLLSICAPLCDPDANVMCPIEEMTCAPQQDESALCFIQ